MTSKLYKAKHGTNHIVKVNNMVREMLKGEKYQAGLIIYNGIRAIFRKLQGNQ